VNGCFRRVLMAGVSAVALLGAAAGPATAKESGADSASRRLQQIRHFVVIYQENHSFDNLYGTWPRVDGLRRARPSRTIQVAQDGTPYRCLLQTDVNLQSPPLPADCANPAPAFSSHFPNAPFLVDDYLRPEDKTCPLPPGTNPTPKGEGTPGGCTRDLVHRFYQEQYQLNGGRQNRYATGSDAAGLVMGVYDTRRLPIYRYLHGPRHPRYVISDRFFQAAFGGSFLNHQWLVAAATPVFENAVDDGSADDLHTLVDANGMPTSYPLYSVTPAGTPTKDTALTVACSAPHPAGLACGDYAVNTIQPAYQPYSPTSRPATRLTPQKAPTIGDRLSAAGIDWAWYAGGWSNANGDVGGHGWTNGTTPGACGDPDTMAGAVWPNCPNRLFQFHHQPFNYFAAYAPGTEARAQHLRDEDEFVDAVAGSGRQCKLKPVSFIKPIGAENEHPGYASEHFGSDHVVDLLRAIQGSRCARDTMVVVTYDEFGGQWDHVPPPGQGTRTPGPHDEFGPGTRIPALTIAPNLRSAAGVDRVSHDTTSIIATMERRFGLEPVAERDAAVRDLSSVFRAR
jgi:acid phosphatase